MLAVGLALLGDGRDAEGALDRLLDHLAAADFGWLAGFIEAEADACRAGELVHYHAARHAITVLADTTERAPTFNLRPFENRTEPRPLLSPCTLVVDGAGDGAAAWRILLGRAPRPLGWPEHAQVTGAAWLAGFDFSAGAADRRASLAAGAAAGPHRFAISRERDRCGGARCSRSRCCSSSPSTFTRPWSWAASIAIATTS